ncbi:Fe-S cluster assembly protein SufD [Ghiorsea bivora]|uniref:Fe-S cluster assembly protein SufD n=1 Tax=Ghiorsea bivora TaxID=1485545 RepID=UPI0005703040|nr:Fe-S cluster assembly protein SufD [Ghiorsea bivora]
MSMLTQTRQNALSLFESMGLPSQRDEDWKYTDASRLKNLLKSKGSDASIDVKNLGINELDAYHMVFINGAFAANESNLPQGVDIQSLNALETSTDNNAKALAELFQVSSADPLMNGFAAYNAATAKDGAAVCLADNSKLDKPLYILHVSNQSHTIRHGLMLGKHAEAQVIEHFISLSEDKALSNATTAIILKDGARLEHSRIQQEGKNQSHVARVDVKQMANSSYQFHGIEIGGILSRTDLIVNLSGKGASCDLNGLFVLGGRQHADHHTRIDHTAPHCTSRELYRTVLDGRSHGVFNGKVMVHEGAIKTDSNMSNGNILLSKNAEIDTKPELEIYNDDVKCAHGATIGQLDDKQLFYLRSRGISAEAAQELLTFAFADEVLVAMSNQTVRRYVEKAAFAKLPHGADLEEMLGS